jgi:hypothetical protein
MSQARNQDESGSKQLNTGFLFGLFFDPEDGGDMFLRNVGYLSKDYMALYPEDRNHRIHGCENLRYYIILLVKIKHGVSY